VKKGKLNHRGHREHRDKREKKKMREDGTDQKDLSPIFRSPVISANSNSLSS